jgi:hypothetical protein
LDDLIKGFVRLMDSPGELTGPVNLGNPGELPMIALAEAVKELTGSRSPLVHELLPQDDTRQRQPDIALAREQLGREPTVAPRSAPSALPGLLTRRPPRRPPGRPAPPLRRATIPTGCNAPPPAAPTPRRSPAERLSPCGSLRHPIRQRRRPIRGPHTHRCIRYQDVVDYM